MRPADKRLDRQGEKCYYLLGDTMKTKNLIALALCVLICAAAIGAVRYMAEAAVLDNGGAASAPPVTTPDITPSPTPMPTPSPTLEPTPEPTPELPAVDINSWELRLANINNSIGEYEPELEEIENGQMFDTRAADALREFMQAARDEGLSVFLSSAYRGYAEQQYLYNRKVAQVGEEQAKTIVAPPGTSEHQTGLSADITDRYYEVKNSSLENTELYKWMSAHCQEYGFIVRYPKDKEDVTGIIYEPWHFRYVGVEAATYIMEHGLCLEEFIELYK